MTQIPMSPLSGTGVDSARELAVLNAIAEALTRV